MRPEDALTEAKAASDASVRDSAHVRDASTTNVVTKRTGRMRVDAPSPMGSERAPTVQKTFDYRTIRGILPTVLTPYDDDEQVDATALDAQVRYLVNAGVHGLLLMGSFGESPYLGDTDREVVITTSEQACEGKVPIVVGITAESTYVASEQLEQAYEHGASAVMVCLPQYFKLKFEDVKRHYMRLSDMGLLPIFYYHYPAASRLDLKPAQIAELLAIDKVVGIKESTFDMRAIGQHIKLTDELNRIYLSGSELTFMQFMDLGGDGVVGAASLLMPRTAVAMYQAFQGGERIKARELQSLLFETMPLTKDITAPVTLVRPAFLLAMRQGLNVPIDVAPTHARLKAALARRGIPIKPCMRTPLPQFTPRDERAVEHAMLKIMQIEP